MKREAAEILERAAREASATLDGALADAWPHLTPEEQAEWRRKTGNAMGPLYLHWMRPIHEEYADLEPPGMKPDKNDA